MTTPRVTVPVIRLTAHEIQSGYDRQAWAEALIRQLPDDHDGRNSWLINYGETGESVQKRSEWNAQAIKDGRKPSCAFNHETRSTGSAAPAPEGGAVSAASRALLDACIADFGDPKDFPDDDGWVASGDKGDSAVTFKHMRDLQSALATREEAPAEAGDWNPVAEYRDGPKVRPVAVLCENGEVHAAQWQAGRFLGRSKGYERVLRFFDHSGFGLIPVGWKPLSALRAQPPARDGDNDRPIEATWTDGKTHAYVNLSAALSAERKAWRQNLGLRIALVRYLDIETPPAREDAQPVAKPAPFNPGGIGHAMYQAFNAYLADYVLGTDGDDYVPTQFERDLIEDFFAGLMAEEAFFGPVRAPYDAHPAPDALREHERLFKALRDESWDLRCFNIPTGGDDYDIGWRVVGHWQAEPRERTIAEVFSDDPSEAVRQALAALQAEQKGGA